MLQLIVERYLAYITFTFALISWGHFKLQGRHSIHGDTPPPLLFLQLFLQAVSTMCSFFAALQFMTEQKPEMAIVHAVISLITGWFAWEIWIKYRNEMGD